MKLQAGFFDMSWREALQGVTSRAGGLLPAGAVLIACDPVYAADGAEAAPTLLPLGDLGLILLVIAVVFSDALRAALTSRRRDDLAPAAAASLRTAREIALIRAAFFLLVAADAFPYSFLPVFARELERPLPGLSPDLASGLPVTAFWLMVGIAQFTTHLWDRHLDRRILCGCGIFLASAGLVAAGLAGDVIQLCAGRLVSGFGYGMVMILVQDLILTAMAPQARTLGSGLYLSAFFGGAICGTLVGGLLAEAVGFAGVLLIAALISASAIGVVAVLRRPGGRTPSQTLQAGVFLRNRRLMALVICGAIPSRLVISAFIYVLAPLLLYDLGASGPEAGRIVMIYALILATTTAFWSRLVDLTGRPLLFTAAGIFLSGAAMAVIPAGAPGTWGVVAAVGLLGTAQAIGMSPQVTLLFRVAEDEVARFGSTVVLGLYRVCERIGLMAGPLVVAWLTTHHDYSPALAVLALTMATAGLSLIAVFALSGETEPAAPTPSLNGPQSYDPGLTH